MYILTSLPCDCIRINIQSHKFTDLFLSKIIRICFVDAESLESANLDLRELPDTLLLGNQTSPECSVRLGQFMESSGVNLKVLKFPCGIIILLPSSNSTR